MKPRWSAVVVLTCGVALAAGPATAPSPGVEASDRPATRPAAPRPTPFGNRVVRLRDLGLTGPEWVLSNQDQPVTDDVWQEVTEFGKTNFPNRWALFETLQKNRGVDDPLVRNIRSRFVGRYRLLTRIQGTMPDLFDAAVKQGRLEDEAWAAVIAYRKKRDDSSLNDAMRQKVSTLVKNLLEERQDRLKALQQTLADEQKLLEADRDNVDDLVDRQIARLSGDDPGNERFGRDGGGFGGFGRGGFGRREFDRGGRMPPPPTTQP